LYLDSLPEENDVFNRSVSQNVTSENKSDPRDSTYDTLHGVSTPTRNQHELDEYDIFDDLC